MGNKNWIEFNNNENKYQKKSELDNSRKKLKINILKQKKGKKGKTITLIKGLGIEDGIQIKNCLKK